MIQRLNSKQQRGVSPYSQHFFAGPIDTFSKETLIRITGRSTYTDKTGRKWRLNDFVLSALLETHGWKSEPMVLVSSGQLIEQLGLDKTHRSFSFTQLAGSAELQRLANEAQTRKRAGWTGPGGL